MRIELEWQDAPGVRDRVLAATWARLRIDVGGSCVTEALDLRSESRRAGVYGSLFPMAEWIVENWWPLLHEQCPVSPVPGGRAARSWIKDWIQRHNLLAARDGSALPDLTCVRDGDDVVLHWEQDPAEWGPRRVRFVSQGQHRVALEQFSKALAAFVNSVIARLDVLAMDDDDSSRLRNDWAAIHASESDEAELCRIMAMLGLDPYDPDEATDEIIAVVKRTITALPVPLKWDFIEGTRPSDLESDLLWLDNRDRLHAGHQHPPTSISPGWAASAHETGYGLARETRRDVLRLSDQEAIHDLEQRLVDCLGWEPEVEITAPAAGTFRLDSLVGFSAHGGKPVLVVPSAKSKTGERFRLSRAVFLKVSGALDISPRLLTQAYTPLQRASRAFAAELLAPSSALAERVPSSVSQEQVEALATEFGVSPLLIAHQIENHALGQVEL